MNIVDKTQDTPKCLSCGKALKSKRTKFCSRKCIKTYRRNNNKHGSPVLVFYEVFIGFFRLILS